MLRKKKKELFISYTFPFHLRYQPVKYGVNQTEVIIPTPFLDLDCYNVRLYKFASNMTRGKGYNLLNPKKVEINKVSTIMF
jgi:hypothetical protein